jgi:hypothetical protein
MPPWSLRLSIGIEGLEDLRNDLAGGLERVQRVIESPSLSRAVSGC